MHFSLHTLIRSPDTSLPQAAVESPEHMYGIICARLEQILSVSRVPHANNYITSVQARLASVRFAVHGALVLACSVLPGTAL